MATNFTEENRKFFDDLADKYDVQEWQRSFLAKTTEFVQQSVDFLGLSKSSDSEGPSSANGSSDVSLLDYACGTGALSRALGPFVSHIQGVDLSTKMVERYNQLAATSIIPSVQKATARVGDLLSEAEPAGELSGPELHGFSFAGVSAGFHHFERLQLAIDRLAGRLRPGGVLFILDFVEEEGKTCPSSAADATIHKHGFAKEEMKGFMDHAGLVNFDWKVASEEVKLAMNPENPIYRKLFLAKAERK